MSQTVFNQDPAVAVEGMISNLSPHRELITAAAEGAIPFGKFCAQGTLAGQCILPAATGDVTDDDAFGFAISDTSQEGDGTTGWLDEQAVTIMRRGTMHVLTEDAVTRGGLVFVRFAVTNFGGVRSDADTANAVALPGATFRETTAGAGLVIIEISPQV